MQVSDRTKSALNLGNIHIIVNNVNILTLYKKREAQSNWTLCCEMTSLCWFVTAQLSSIKDLTTLRVPPGSLPYELKKYTFISIYLSYCGNEAVCSVLCDCMRPHFNQ